MSNKEQYAAFFQRHPDMPVMMQPWWLEAVCAGKEWDVMLVKQSEISSQKSEISSQPSAVSDQNADEEIVAAMPYLLRKRLWYKFIVMPQMTLFGGIWMNSELHASPDLQKRLAKLIVKRLKAMHIAYYYQHYPVGNPLPHWLGKQWMKVEERVTYRIDDLSSVELPEDTYSKNKQRQLKKAEDLQLDFDMSAEEFYAFHKQCIGERQRKLSYSREFLLVLERKARRAGQCAIIRISEVRSQMSDVSGHQSEVSGQQTLAAAFVVWDKNYLYYLLPAYLPSAAKSGASARLADEAIRLAKQKGLRFDFEGGNDDEGVANHYRQFGSKAVHYSSVSKIYRPSFALLLWLNKLRGRLLFRI